MWRIVLYLVSCQSILSQGRQGVCINQAAKLNNLPVAGILLASLVTDPASEDMNWLCISSPSSCSTLTAGPAHMQDFTQLLTCTWRPRQTLLECHVQAILMIEACTNQVSPPK